MEHQDLQKFSSQTYPDLLAALKAIAKRDGRQFQSVLTDAMREYRDRHAGQEMRPEIEAAFKESLERLDDVYRKLA